MKLFKYGFTALLFAGAFVFWGFFHPEILFFHEFYQMFLTGWDYFFERVVLPGGLADYFGEFLTQFYCITLLGASLIALLYAGVQLVVYKIFKIFGVNEKFYPLTFLPSLALWALMCSENLLLCFPVAVFLNLLLFVLAEKFPKTVVFGCVSVFLLILSYWLTGPAAEIAALLLALKNFKENKIFSVITAVVLFVAAWVASRIVCYPVASSFVGIDYLRYPFRNLSYLMMFGLCPVLPYALSFVKKDFSLKKSYAAAFSLAVLTPVVLPKCFNDTAWQTIRMYSYIYNSQWDEAVEFYDKYRTGNSYSVQSLNLALAEKGLLTERMFLLLPAGNTCYSE